jgi:hypothetical protein
MARLTYVSELCGISRRSELLKSKFFAALAKIIQFSQFIY